ncbi:MAG TPA: hypothetical protein VFR32_04385 [Gaiellaceae bacterium]|nr:hypothetical protein [Gaiellaceae bacterium]
MGGLVGHSPEGPLGDHEGNGQRRLRASGFAEARFDAADDVDERLARYPLHE